MSNHDTSSTSKSGSENATSYTCPMHTDIQQDNSGKCLKCGMNLLDGTNNNDEGAQQMNCCHGPGQTSEEPKKTEAYSCPMHPEVKEDKSGKCPTCGMNLVQASNRSGGIVGRLLGRHGHNA